MPPARGWAVNDGRFAARAVENPGRAVRIAVARPLGLIRADPRLASMEQLHPVMVLAKPAFYLWRIGVVR